MMEYLRNHPEALVAVLALLVSCIAIWQAREALSVQREHNHKSLLPIHSVNRLTYQNKFGVELENRGAGPMIVQSVTVIDTTNPTREATSLIELMPDPLKHDMKWNDYKKGLKNVALQPGKKFDLLLFQTSEKPSLEFQDNRNDMWRAIIPLKLQLVYEDVYKNSFETSEYFTIYQGLLDEAEKKEKETSEYNQSAN